MAVNDLSKAYANYRVGEYVTFSKNVKPFTDANVQVFDELTVDGTCNQDVAQRCVNKYIVNGFNADSK